MNSEKEIYKTVEKYLVKRKLSALKTLLENTGIELSEELIQKAYNHYIGKWAPSIWEIDDMDFLKKLTGIQPLEEIVQKGYNNIIRNGYDSIETTINMVKSLEKVTGVEPSEQNRKALTEKQVYNELTPKTEQFLKDCIDFKNFIFSSWKKYKTL